MRPDSDGYSFGMTDADDETTAPNAPDRDRRAPDADRPPDADEVAELDPDAPGRWMFEDPQTDAPEPNEPA